MYLYFLKNNFSVQSIFTKTQKNKLKFELKRRKKKIYETKGVKFTLTR